MNQELVERLSNDDDENQIINGGDIDYLELDGDFMFLNVNRG